LSSNGNNLNVEWRRNKVLELSSQGFTQSDIATVLHVTQPTVNKDLAHIRKQAQENLEQLHHIHEVIPFEYHKAMTGMKHNLKQTLEIAENSSDPRVKLEARRIANDCYKYIMDLTTNSTVVTDAIKYVTQKQEKIDTLKMIDERIEAFPPTGEGEETTTNGVF
jgi:predicted transcriptional regulator